MNETNKEPAEVEVMPDEVETKLEAFEERGLSKRENENLPAPRIDDNFLATIERLAANPDVDPKKIEQLMDLQERVLDRSAEEAFNRDMVECQKAIPAIPRDLWNDQTQSWYSAYQTILKFTKPVYTEWGFAISFYEEDPPEEKKDEVRICADVMHDKGWTVKRFVDYPIDDKGPKGAPSKTKTHGKKSSISYAKGTLICMIFNIPTGTDDDGNAAGGVLKKPINEKQMSTILDFINEKEVDEKKFLEYLTRINDGAVIDSVQNIPADLFNNAIKLLKDKKKGAKPKPKPSPQSQKELPAE